MARIASKMGSSPVPPTIGPSPSPAPMPAKPMGPTFGGAANVIGKARRVGAGGPGPMGRMKSPTMTKPRKQIGR